MPEQDVGQYQPKTRDNTDLLSKNNVLSIKHVIRDASSYELSTKNMYLAYVPLAL